MKKQALLFFATATAAYGADYSWKLLQIPGNTQQYYPQELSENGSAIGYIDREDGNGGTARFAVVWGQTGVPQYLPSPGAALGLGVANGTTPVGSAALTLGAPNAGPVIWTSQGMTALPSPEGIGQVYCGFGQLFGGQIGYLTPTAIDTRAAYWDAAGVHEVAIDEVLFSRIRSINSSGTYVGTYIDDSEPGFWRMGGFVGSGGNATKLNYPGFNETFAFDINEDGWFIGTWVDYTHLADRAYIARGSEIHDLGLFPGFGETWVNSINNANTVVGGAANFADFEKALIWPNGSLLPQDLNAMVDIPDVTLIRGLNVNDAGQILGEGRLNDGSGFAYFVLTPVPEPAFASLVVASAALLRRRQGSVRLPTDSARRIILNSREFASSALRTQSRSTQRP